MNPFMNELFFIFNIYRYNIYRINYFHEYTILKKEYMKLQGRATKRCLDDISESTGLYSITPNIVNCRIDPQSDKGQVLIALQGSRIDFPNGYSFWGSTLEGLQPLFTITEIMPMEVRQQFNRIKENLENILNELITLNFIELSYQYSPPN